MAAAGDPPWGGGAAAAREENGKENGAEEAEAQAAQKAVPRPASTLARPMFEVVGDVEAYREAYFARIPGLRSTQPELKYRPAQPAEDASGVTLTPREARPSVQTAAAVGCFGYARVQPIPLDGKDPPKQV